MAQIPVALQTYSVRHIWAEKPVDVLKTLADTGYDAVELYNADYERDPSELRKMLDDHGLRCSGAHTGLGRLQDETFEKTVAFAKTVGYDFLIVPGLGEEYTKTADGWRRAAEQISGIAEKLKAHGMRTGYHNHWIEFSPIDGELPWDIFFSNADPSVIMQFDTGNALRGSKDIDPVEFLRRYPGRALSVHLKDYGAQRGADAVIGEGDVDFKALLPVCESIGDTRWYVIEHEDESVDALDAAVRCFGGLKAIRGL